MTVTLARPVSAALIFCVPVYLKFYTGKVKFLVLGDFNQFCGVLSHDWHYINKSSFSKQCWCVVLLLLLLLLL